MADSWTPHPSTSSSCSMNWTICALCQSQEDSNKLRNPSQRKNKSQPCGYTVLARNISSLRELNALPSFVDISRLDDGSGIEQTLRKNQAKWHKSCYDKFQPWRASYINLKRERENTEDYSSPVKKKLRSSFSGTHSPMPETRDDQHDQAACFFCDKVDSVPNMHLSATLGSDQNVRTWATEMRDSKLLSKLSSGDMPALDAYYHYECRTKLYNQYKSFCRQNEISKSSDVTHQSIALAELIAHIEDARISESGEVVIFKLADLVKLYDDMLIQIGAKEGGRSNSTRLKEQLLRLVPDLEAHTTKQGIVLSFKDEIGETLLQASKKQSDTDALTLMRAATIIRKSIFSIKYNFKGNLNDEQYDVRPQPLVALLQMIMGGTNIQVQAENYNMVHSAVLSVTDLIVFNSNKRSRKEPVHVRHNSDRESVLPLYTGLLIYNQTRKRGLVDILFQKGLSVSYDRITQVSTDIANGVIDLFHRDGVVCPPSLKTGLYTTGNLDNIDHNPSSNSAKSSFHGTALSLTQHPCKNNRGITRQHIDELIPNDKATRLRVIKPLPESYAIVRPLPFNSKVQPPAITFPPATEFGDTPEGRNAPVNSLSDASDHRNDHSDSPQHIPPIVRFPVPDDANPSVIHVDDSLEHCPVSDDRVSDDAQAQDPIHEGDSQVSLDQQDGVPEHITSPIGDSEPFLTPGDALPHPTAPDNVPDRLTANNIFPLPENNVDDRAHNEWLEQLRDLLLKKDSFDAKDSVSWSAYFANMQGAATFQPSITALLPLFRESSHSFAMVKHGMDVIKQATQLLNPNQVPVITLDQPLYAIAKLIQWTWQPEYGESSFVVLLGGLHIEMALLKVLGEWLLSSGWTELMSRAGVTTEGRAEELLKGSKTSRGQWAHQVSFAALSMLKDDAYEDYCLRNTQQSLSYEDWCSEMEEVHPQFKYWCIVMRLQEIFLQFLRAQREGDLTLYVSALSKVCPWMFALDHIHYARWLSVHTLDLKMLPSICPPAHEEFTNGKFVTHKTSRPFSALAHDQVHEQMNAVLKGDGGIIGITENEDALRRWLVVGPEVSRMIDAYEEEHRKSITQPGVHHEQTASEQGRFARNVKNVIEEFCVAGNPFLDESTELVSIDTSHKIICEDVVETVYKVEIKGQEQYDNFVKHRLLDKTLDFHEAVTKNKFPLFTTGSKKPSKSKQTLAVAKADANLFSKLYISCQTRGGNLDHFFAHENQPWPPSLAEHNQMRHGNKAGLVHCLEGTAESSIERPSVDVKLLDGAQMVQKMDPKKSHIKINTFEEYVTVVIHPHILRELETVSRLDLVWDVYLPNSLKSSLRECRGSGDPVRVHADTKIPSDWNSFLRNSANKTSLFVYIATTLETLPMPDGKLFLSTCREDVISVPPSDVSDLTPCTHEEADYRLMLHANHAYENGYRSIEIQASDTDVAVLSVTLASSLTECTIWLLFGQGKSSRYIPVHEIASALGPSAKGLPFLHALSGCDTVSSFCGIGKKTVYDTWRLMVHLGDVFHRLSTPIAEISVDDMTELERFVVVLYSKTLPLSKVNEARKHLFCHNNRQIEHIPPSSAALNQHLKRAVYQAGHMWGQALVKNPSLPSPGDWGWTRDDDNSWVPFWTTLPEASEACRELVKCKCMKGCVRRCSCVKANLKCTALCGCVENCNRD